MMPDTVAVILFALACGAVVSMVFICTRPFVRWGDGVEKRLENIEARLHEIEAKLDVLAADVDAAKETP